MLIPLEDLSKRYSIDADFVLHVGANVGEEMQAYDIAGIRRTIWIEANSEIFEKLQLNILRYQGDHICLKACISDTDGKPVNFAITNNNSQSSSILELGTHKEAHPEVHVVRRETLTATRIDSLLKRHKIKLLGRGFLNIDLQGAELLALSGMGELIKHFKYAYMEVNERELYKNCALIPQIDSFFEQFGFGRVETKMTGAGWGDAFYIKKI